MKKLALALGAVLILGGIGFGVWFWVMKPRREAAAALKNVPKDSMVVIEVHVKKALEFGPLKAALEMPEAQAGLAVAKLKCGFDPIAKIDDLYIAVRAVNNEPQFGFVVRGSFTQAELDNCLKALSDTGWVAGPAIGSHPTYTREPKPPAPGSFERASSRDPITLALGAGVMMGGSPEWVGDVVKVADGQAEGADKSDGLMGIRRMLKGGPTLAVSFDMAMFKSGMPGLWAKAQGGMSNPMVAGMLGKLASLQSAGIAVTVDGSSLKYLMLVKFGSRDDAKAVAEALDPLMKLGKTFAGPGMSKERDRLKTKIDQLSAADPALKAQLEPALGKYAIIERMIGALEIKQDGDAVKMELVFSAADITTLVAAVKADKLIKDKERAQWDTPSTTAPYVPLGGSAIQPPTAPLPMPASP